MPSDAANQWTQFYTKNTEMMYPAEAVIRIFKGTYPNLKMPKPKRGDRILDVGCGDGRHFELFSDIGMDLSGTEVTPEIVASVAERLSEIGEIGIRADLRVGTCASLPWPDATFDYELSWNSCYYMGPDGKFEDHVAEMARVLKPGGWLVGSIPRSDCFIFKDSEATDDRHYRIIRDDYFGLRNGERMFVVYHERQIEIAFASHFANFCHADIDINMFGLKYTWHVFTAERRT